MVVYQATPNRELTHPPNGTTGEAYRRFLARLDEARGQGVTLGLERVEQALQCLGSPHHRVPAIHIAGTNGKGSCAAMTESILRSAGFRTGLYTSPHLVHFVERIRIAGKEIDGERLAQLDYRLAATGIPLSFFEIATVLALLAFAEDGVEIAVLETGLGGRLDATTTCHPLASAITTIAMDHEAILGNSLEAIAYEKACIAKPGIPLFVGLLADTALQVVTHVAEERGAPLRVLGKDIPPAPCPPALEGAHQMKNAAIAVALAIHAAEKLRRPIEQGAILEGLRRVRWPGRLERVSGNLLFDCAHNPEGAQALAAALPDFSYRILVTSIVRDKDAASMLAIWAPLFDHIVLTSSPSERSRSPASLASLISATRGGGCVTTCVHDPRKALDFALSQATPKEGLVVVAGSIFLVGALRDQSPYGVLEPTDPAP
jgi:dihydrofolate synthase/folylpolyglutamate synthase